MTADEYEDEFIRLCYALVPYSGEASTVQGEVVRAIGRLRRECEVNGNLNWDDSDYYQSLTDFLEAHLCGPQVFGEKLVDDAIEDIRETIGQVRAYANCDADALDYLQSIVVDWCKSRPDPIPRSRGECR